MDLHFRRTKQIPVAYGMYGTKNRRRGLFFVSKSLLLGTMFVWSGLQGINAAANGAGQTSPDKESQKQKDSQSIEKTISQKMQNVSGPGLMIRNDDIKHGKRYVYELTYTDMAKGETAFPGDLYAHHNLRGDDGILYQKDFPRGAPAMDKRDRFISHAGQVKEAWFTYKFNFSKCDYRPVEARIRDKVSVTDRGGQAIRVTVAYKTNKGDWQVLRQHTSGDSYKKLATHDTVALNRPKSVYYVVHFQAVKGDRDGKLNGYQNQWNRLSSAGSKGFRVEFKMQSAK